MYGGHAFSNLPLPAPLAVVVEGPNDVEFLKRISRILAGHDPSLPDLISLEAAGRIAFVMTGASTPCPIPAALCGFGPPEFHLYDREMSPLTEQRRCLVEAINQRPGCRAILTRRRSLENYLHPHAIQEAQGISISFGPNHDVAEVAARAIFSRFHSGAWPHLSPRGRRRLRDKVKRWLNREAVDCMTVERLQEHDPDGEIISWLRGIQEWLPSPITSDSP